MDVYSSYLPDVLSYTSFRHSYANKQPSAWSMEAPKEKRNRDAIEKKGKKSCEDCPICQERRRRPLATYIRSKSVQDRCTTNSISEDSEEVAEEEVEGESSTKVTVPLVKTEVGEKKPAKK